MSQTTGFKKLIPTTSQWSQILEVCRYDAYLLEAAKLTRKEQPNIQPPSTPSHEARTFFGVFQTHLIQLRDALIQTCTQNEQSMTCVQTAWNGCRIETQ